LDAGADIQFEDPNGYTALIHVMYALYNDERLVPMVKFLIEKGADPKALQDDGETLLWQAASREMATLLIDAGVDPMHKSALGDYAIHQACRRSHKEVVEVLLERKVPIDLVGRWNMRPFNSAAASLIGEPRPLVQFLLDKGADINSRGLNGGTALHDCATANLIEMALYLLTRGADVDAKDNDGKTPKDAAVQAGKVDRVDMINLLVRHGADGGKGTLIPRNRD
jgi:cytohesin